MLGHSLGTRSRRSGRLRSSRQSARARSRHGWGVAQGDEAVWKVRWPEATGRAIIAQLGDETFSAVDHLRQRFGVATLPELRGRQLQTADRDHVVDTYLRLAESVTAPPQKADGELRPVFMTSAVSRLDEAEAAARATLMYHSVAVILPNSINYPLRMLRLLVLLEPLIDSGLVILLPEEVLHTRTALPLELDGVASYFKAAFSATLLDPGGNRPESADAVVEALEIGAAMDACSIFPHHLDFTCTSPSQVAVVRNLLGIIEASSEDRRLLAADRVRCLPDLFHYRCRTSK